jgi:transposase-like protein
MGRKVFDRQFKMIAVKLILDEKIPVSQVAKELSLHSNSLYH